MNEREIMIVIFLITMPIAIYIASKIKKKYHYLSPFRNTQEYEKIEKKNIYKIDEKAIIKNKKRMQEIKNEEDEKDSYTTIKKDFKNKVTEDKEENSFYKLKG